MLKEFWNNIKLFFQNLGTTIKTIFNPGAYDSFDEERERRYSLRNQSSLNQQPYQDGSYLDNDPSRLYNYYNQLGPGGVESLANKYSEAGITGQQAALNEMSLDNQRRQYAFQVQGMQEAGLNPALMYESGATQGPSAPAPTQGATISELIQLMLLDKQSKYLQAQTRNVDADTDKKKAETAQIELINKYYPELTQTQIDKTLKDMGLTDEQIKKIQSEVDLNKLDKDLKELDKIIKKAQADESSAYYKATRELEQAKTESERARAREAQARAIMEELEGQFMEKYGAKMGSSEWIALASALSGLFGIDLDAFSKSPIEGVINEFRTRHAAKHPRGESSGGGSR